MKMSYEIYVNKEMKEVVEQFIDLLSAELTTSKLMNFNEKYNFIYDYDESIVIKGSDSSISDNTTAELFFESVLNENHLTVLDLFPISNLENPKKLDEQTVVFSVNFNSDKQEELFRIIIDSNYDDYISCIDEKYPNLEFQDISSDKSDSSMVIYDILDFNYRFRSRAKRRDNEGKFVEKIETARVRIDKDLFNFADKLISSSEAKISVSDLINMILAEEFSFFSEADITTYAEEHISYLCEKFAR